MELTNALAVDYEDPALEGQNITFTCASSLTLSGPNISTCMENGEWEPDPREVECTGECCYYTLNFESDYVMFLTCRVWYTNKYH